MVTQPLACDEVLQGRPFLAVPGDRIENIRDSLSESCAAPESFGRDLYGVGVVPR